MPEPSPEYPAARPSRSVAAAQRVAVAASVAALLMFGALVYNGSSTVRRVAPPVSAPPLVVAEGCPEATRGEAETDKARKAVNEFIRDNVAGSRVEGVFLLDIGYESDLYLGRADVTLPENKRRAVSCLVVRYTRRNGSTYWRAESLSRQTEETLLRRAIDTAAQ